MTFQDYRSLLAHLAGSDDVEYDPSRLTGFFNRFRPSGKGLEAVFPDASHAQVHARVQNIFAATAQGWQPSDLYFVVRSAGPLLLDEATLLVRRHLNGMKALGESLNQREIVEAIDSLRSYRIVDAISPMAESSDLDILMYEVVTDQLAVVGVADSELVALKEAFYSMANNYFLVAYILAPIVSTPWGYSFDSYFDLWRRGLRFATTGTDVRIAQCGTVS